MDRVTELSQLALSTSFFTLTVSTNMEKTAGIVTSAPKRPSRNPRPTTTLLELSKRAALPSQEKKINEYRAAEAAKQLRLEAISTLTTAATSAATTPAPSVAPSPTCSSISALEFPSSPETRHGSTHVATSKKRKATVSDSDEEEGLEPENDENDDENDPVSESNKCKKTLCFD